MIRTVLSAAAVLVSISSVAHAIDVYPGCAVPALKAGHRTFYVDPVRGSDKGDGSALKPWKDLTSVIGPTTQLLSSKAWSNAKNAYVDINPTGPIKPGDVIMLMGGNYGTLRILNAFNTDFVWLMAAPGQTPVIRQLNVISAGKWVFQGIKFQGETSAPGTDPNKRAVDGQVTVGAGDYTGTTNNIIFNADSFSTTDDASKWSDMDWLLKPYFTSFQSRATCVSLTNSKFYNVFNGVMLGLDHNLMQGNNLDSFAKDGVDLTHGYTTVRGNTFTNGKNSKIDPQHADAIQGWSDIITVNGKRTTELNSNVTIEQNVILKYGDPKLTYLQGISMFDGKWDNLVVQNNVVVTNTTNGISVFGATNSRIVNNTIVGSYESVLPMLWVQKAKDGTPSKNVIVRNNIGSTFAVADSGVTADHNLISGQFITMVNGAAARVTKSQEAQKNILVQNPASLFVGLNGKASNYDLRLKPGSAAVQTGSSVLAPKVDVIGKARTPVVDVGAYAH